MLGSVARPPPARCKRIAGVWGWVTGVPPSWSDSFRPLSCTRPALASLSLRDRGGENEDRLLPRTSTTCPRLRGSRKALRDDVQFFSHGGPYEWVARDVLSVEPQMSPRARQYMRFNRSPFATATLPVRGASKEYVSAETAALDARSTVLIGWNLASSSDPDHRTAARAPRPADGRSYRL